MPATTSLLSSINERQCDVNNFWPSIMVNQSVMWPLMNIYKVVTGFKG